MTKNNSIDLPDDYALVLHQIKENGEEDFPSLTKSLPISKSRLHHIIDALHRKKLITVRSKWNESWIRLSTKGQRLANYIWPEASYLNNGLSQF